MLNKLFRRNQDEIFNTVTDIALSSILEFEGVEQAFTNDGKAEMLVFNLIYGWLYMQDNNLIRMNDRNAEMYFKKGYDKIRSLKPNLGYIEFANILKDRLNYHKDELLQIRKTNLSEDKYLPQYLFRRLYIYPLSLDPMPNIGDVYEDFWVSENNYHTYVLNVNHLQNSLKANI